MWNVIMSEWKCLIPRWRYDVSTFVVFFLREELGYLKRDSAALSKILLKGFLQLWLRQIHYFP